MARSEIHVDGLTDALDMGFSFSSFLDDSAAELTTEHAQASYGQPVLVKDGTAYGPADLEGVTLRMSATNAADAELIAPASAAGWSVKVNAWCDYCGKELSAPETRKPGDRHAACENR